MVSEVAENKPAEFVSISHYGFLNSDTKITSGEEVEKSAGGLENYSCDENQRITHWKN